MRRSGLSRPVRLALTHELLSPRQTFFDYGCGRGDDVSGLAEIGIDAQGWDPAHFPNRPLRKSDIVNLGYVVNVIEDPLERALTVRRAWELANHVLVVAARLPDEQNDAHVAPHGDGWLTRQGTFQKFFEHEELGVWLAATLSCDPVAASLGVYYVFRNRLERERYLASRFHRPATLPKRRVSDERFEANRELLVPLIEFLAARGRLPNGEELPNSTEVISAFGSVRQAVRVVLTVTDSSSWERVRHLRAVDLLVHLALARFHGRSRWSDLPPELQLDIRAFFSSYKAACGQSDRLLFSTANLEAIAIACRASGVGKITPSALYVHANCLSELPALLRVYEGCGRALVGTVEGANLIKLSREEPHVSYLSYPAFDSDAHPVLEKSVVCDLRQLRVRMFSFSHRPNPPILHRKELFVSPSYPGRDKFARLTAREEILGLYESPEAIGTVTGWRGVCQRAGIAFRGHTIVRTERWKAEGADADGGSQPRESKGGT